MLEPKNPDDGGDSAKLDPKTQDLGQTKPLDPKSEKGSASSEGELDK